VVSSHEFRFIPRTARKAKKARSLQTVLFNLVE